MKEMIKHYDIVRRY